MDRGIGKVMVAFTALFTLAVIAVLVSQNASTSKVIQAFTGGTASVIGAAVSPVTGKGQQGGG